MTVTIRRIRGTEGEVLRSVRLAALADAPTAFAMTFAQESADPPHRWIEAAAVRSSSPTDATFFTEMDGRVVGLVGTYRSTDGWFHLVSMWVSGIARRRGIATALTETVIDMARTAGSPGVFLWVNAANTAAIAMYERAGFEFDGAAQPLPSFAEQTERRMRLTL